MKIIKLTLTLIIAALATGIPAAGETSADGGWTHVDQAAVATQSAVTGPTWVAPARYAAYSMNEPVIRAAAQAAPHELQVAPKSSTAIITVPKPDGTFERFQIVEAPAMEPGLAAQFPEIHTFTGVGVDDPTANLRGGITSIGFHASVRNGVDNYNVDALYQGNTSLHVSYYLRDSGETTAFECSEDELVSEMREHVTAHADAGISFGTNLRTYRAAIATTGEYAAQAGGNVPAVIAVLTTLVNRVNQIFETEVAVRLVLVGNNNLVVFLNPATDGYTNGSTGVTLTENQTILPPIIGDANYDIGHVMNSTGGGRASLGVVCNNGSKARGTTGIASGNVLSNGSVIFLAHEMGHMFNASHVWNGVNGNCTPAEYSAADSYEPGSGTTIMSYAGTCGTDNIIAFPWDAYYHRHSLNQIINFVTGTGCPVVTASGNNPPAVNAGTDIWVPISTPFKLHAVGSDPEDDTVFYNWEQFDTSGVGRALGTADPGNGPLFRSVFPAINGNRYIPRNPAEPDNTEQLPTVQPRDINFIVTARDFRMGGGGTNEDAMVIHVIDTPAQPFTVTVGNAAGQFWGGTTRNITWNVAGTDTLPYNIFNVNIMLSTDGGDTYPYMLAENTPNDGAQLVNLPSVNSNQVRIRVEPSLSGVYDISDANIILGGQIEINPIVADHGVVCPGDQIDRTIEVFNVGSGDLTINSILAGGSSAFSLVPTNGSPEPELPLTIPRGDHVNFTVRFIAPTTLGAHTATFTFSSNDQTRASAIATATATVGEPNISTIIPNSGSFGDVCIGDIKDMPVTVNNNGMCDLIISNISSNSADFIIPNVLVYPVTVQPGTSLEVPIRFQPTTLGLKAGTIMIDSNDPDQPTKFVNVSGNVPGGNITVTPCPIEFGLVCPEDLEARMKEVTVCNTGKCPLNVNTVTITGMDFTLEGVPPLPATLQSGSCFTFKVKFTPTSIGPKMATLTITSDDPDTPVVNCTVTGETVASTIGIPEKIFFQPTVISTVGYCPGDEPIAITGNGMCEVKVTTVTISGLNAASYSLVGLPSSDAPLTLAPGEQLGDGDLRVRFAPSEMLTERFHMAQVDVTYIKDPFTLEEETLTIPLAGEACQTGFRMLVRAGGVPVDEVLKINATVKGLNGNGKKSKVNLKQKNATRRSIDAPVPFVDELSAQYHAEFGALTNSAQLPTGEVLMKVQYKIGNKKKTKTVRFQTIDTCSFNKDVIVDF